MDGLARARIEDKRGGSGDETILGAAPRPAIASGWSYYFITFAVCLAFTLAGCSAL